MTAGNSLRWEFVSPNLLLHIIIGLYMYVYLSIYHAYDYVHACTKSAYKNARFSTHNPACIQLTYWPTKLHTRPCIYTYNCPKCVPLGSSLTYQNKSATRTATFFLLHLLCTYWHTKDCKQNPAYAVVL